MYVIDIVPEDMPHITPVADAIVPIDGELLDHVPPDGVPDNTVHAPVHITGPEMPDGGRFTVTV
ncbi:hypothetical protein GCM10023093_07440 [Nemorincola caseinilytica]|uniref:Uncharacterized protein n=1 Tax=Nemorincola caseinilytica TaxID=2054315 RepID=A0ABP8N5X9_9BACT